MSKESEAPQRNVWLRRADLDDLCDCGPGCETDVQALYSPESIIVTGMDKYVPEATLLAAESRLAKAVDVLRKIEDQSGGEVEMSFWARDVLRELGEK